MTATNWLAQSIIYSLGSFSSGGYVIKSFEVGYGSGTAAVTNTALVNGSVRVMQTGSPDFTTARKVTFQGDFSAPVMSGLQLREFGLFPSGALLIGSLYARECFNAVTFDGTNELQVIYTIEAIPG